MPATESTNKTRKGFLPPVVSTQAENGIRSREPESAGMETRKPIIRGVSSMTSLKRLAVGPNRATAAKPTKKPRVAPKSPWTGVPRSGSGGRDGAAHGDLLRWWGAVRDGIEGSSSGSPTSSRSAPSAARSASAYGLSLPSNAASIRARAGITHRWPSSARVVRIEAGQGGQHGDRWSGSSPPRRSPSARAAGAAHQEPAPVVALAVEMPSDLEGADRVEVEGVGVELLERPGGQPGGSLSVKRASGTRSAAGASAKAARPAVEIDRRKKTPSCPNIG